jgi:hypothetical protein
VFLHAFDEDPIAQWTHLHWYDLLVGLNVHGSGLRASDFRGFRFSGGCQPVVREA